MDSNIFHSNIFQAKLLILRCDLESRIAENQQRQAVGSSMAYTDFSDIILRVQKIIEEYEQWMTCCDKPKGR